MAIPSSEKLCQKCQKNASTAYSFEYGSLKDWSFKSGTMYNTETWAYQIAGTQKVVLCDQCVKQNWRSRLGRVLLRFLLPTVLTVVFTFGGIYAFQVLDGQPDLPSRTHDMYLAILAICLIAAIVLLYISLYRIRTLGILLESPKTRGEFAAINFELANLKAKYSSYWVTKDHRRKPSLKAW